MSTRREFIQSLPASEPLSPWPGHLVLDESPARAQPAGAPCRDTSIPRARRPSKFTLDVLKQARRTAAVRRQERFRGAEEGAHCSHEGPQDHGGRRPCRLGHGAVPVPGRARRIRQHSSLAAPSVQTEQQLRPLRGDPGHLSGPRLRPLRHLLRPRQDRLDRLRPAGDRRKWFARPGSCSSSMSARACRSRR